jgi:hypothetical protein
LAETYLAVKDSYDNPLSHEALVKLFYHLKQAFEVAAEGGMGDAKWGDQDEADAISGLIGKIWKKYQDAATIEQRGEWEEARLNAKHGHDPNVE